MRLFFLTVLMCSILSYARTIIVEPGDHVSDSLQALFSGDTLYLTSGTYTSSVNEPILQAGTAQSGVIITSPIENRAVLSGEGFERSVICLDGPHPDRILIENLVITGGNATSSDWFAGGGVYVNEASVLITNCLIKENIALIGGGVGAQGGTLDISYTTLEANESLVTGGGIDLYSTIFSGFMVKFLSNISSDDGGGLNSYQSTVTLSNSLFLGNYSGDDGGGVCILQGISDLSFLTIDSNEAFDDGGGIRLHTIDSVSLISSIVTSNIGLAGINVISTNIPEITNTLCWNNGFANYNGMDDPTGNNGNISVDPLYADELRNLSQTFAGQPYDSPAVNSGHAPAYLTVIDGLSTRTDSIPDSDIADMGYHHMNFEQVGFSPAGPNLDCELIITPSPASSSVFITLPADVTDTVTIGIYDSSGRSIATPQVHSSISENTYVWSPAAFLPSGIFFIQADWAGGVSLGRVVILR